MQRVCGFLLVIVFFMLGLEILTFAYFKTNNQMRLRLMNMANRCVSNVIKRKNDVAPICFKSITKHLRNANFDRPFLHTLTSPLPVSLLPEPCRHHFKHYPIPTNISKSSIECLHHRPFTATENAQVIWSVGHIKKILDDNNISYTLLAGSVIGSYRHHGRMPYDDDYDFRVYRPHKKKVKELMRNLMRTNNTFYFEDCEKTRGWDHFHVRIGLRFRNKKEVSHLTAIDFFDYVISKDKFVTTDKGPMLKSIVFPTVKRPLDGMLFDAPRNYFEYFKRYFKGHKMTHCYVNNHNKFRNGCGQALPCSYFRDVIPFVVKFVNGNGTLEVRAVNHTILSIFFQPKVENCN